MTVSPDPNPTDANKRVLSLKEHADILNRVESLLEGGGRSQVMSMSYWNGELGWARNRVTLASDRRDVALFVGRQIRGGRGSAMTNQFDDESLKGVVRSAERQALDAATQRPKDVPLENSTFDQMKTTTWSDATMNRTPEQSSRIVQRLTDKSEAKGFMAAGYLEMHGGAVGQVFIDRYGRKQYAYGRMTQAQCSMTIRNPSGTASGWAGLSGYDVSKIDEVALSDRALEKCVASMNPVRIEPGRYTVILEPQAVADLVNLIINGYGTIMPMDRPSAEQGRSTFTLRGDKDVDRVISKLGLKVVDERITIDQDPGNPEMGIITDPGMRPVTWIKNGVLTNLNSNRGWALNELNENQGVQARASFRMSGGTTSVDEMISTTKRGILVTRFSSPKILDAGSLLSTGVTRDGLWLIENGKISKAIRNFRFTESPLFVLNNIDQLGVPVPVFSPIDMPVVLLFDPAYALKPVVVPPLKARDFSFTSTIDAI